MMILISEICSDSDFWFWFWFPFLISDIRIFWSDLWYMCSAFSSEKVHDLMFFWTVSVFNVIWGRRWLEKKGFYDTCDTISDSESVWFIVFWSVFRTIGGNVIERGICFGTSALCLGVFPLDRLAFVPVISCSVRSPGFCARDLLFC